MSSHLISPSAAASAETASTLFPFSFNIDTCSHIDPSSFAELFNKLPHSTPIHSVINLFKLPHSVADHISTLLTRAKFTPQQLRFLSQQDLQTILRPPFPTPPLQCGCNPMGLIVAGFATISLAKPRFPNFVPQTSRSGIIAVYDSLLTLADQPSNCLEQIQERIRTQCGLYDILLSLLPSSLDVNVTLPVSSPVTAFDVDRIAEDLTFCAQQYHLEHFQHTICPTFLPSLVELQPNSASTTAAGITASTPPKPSIVPPQSSLPLASSSTTTTPAPLSIPLPHASGSANSLHHFNATRPASASHSRPSVSTPSTTNATPHNVQSLNSPVAGGGSNGPAHAAHNARKPRPYFTLNLNNLNASKPTEVSITRRDQHGNQTPLYTPTSASLAAANAVAPQDGAADFVAKQPQPRFSFAADAATVAGSASSSASSVTMPLPGAVPSGNADVANVASPGASPSLEPSAVVPPQISAPNRGSISNPAALAMPALSLHSASSSRTRNNRITQLGDRFAIGNNSAWVPHWKQNSEELRSTLTSWDFTLFRDIPISHRQEILLRLAVFMFVDCGVVYHFNINVHKLTHFLAHISTLYRDNPYHNFLHAWTTLHYTYLLIKHTDRRVDFSDTLLLSMLLSAICHDIDHPGNNNQFEVATMSKLSLLHNDNSVLENHHCFVTFSLLSQPEFSILKNLTQPQLKEVRGLIVSIILNTDMALHNDLTELFGKMSDEVLSVVEDPSKNDPLPIRIFANYSLIARVIVHCADIAGQALPLESAYFWANRFREECNNQVESERRLSIPITTWMTNLTDVNFANSQVGFIQGVLRPLWVRMSITFPTTKPSLQHISANEQFWATYVQQCQSGRNREVSLSTTSSLQSSLASAIDARNGAKNGHHNATPAKAAVASSAAPKSYTLDDHFEIFLKQLEEQKRVTAAAQAAADAAIAASGSSPNSRDDSPEAAVSSESKNSSDITVTTSASSSTAVPAQPAGLDQVPE